MTDGIQNGTPEDQGELSERYCSLWRAIEKFRGELLNEEDVEDDGKGGVRPNEAMRWLMRLDQIIEDEEAWADLESELYASGHGGKNA